jgi:flagellin-like protein
MEKDSAVSPVIGSILLVAITVIIAAVIAAFVFGMTGDIQQTKIVAITSDAAQSNLLGENPNEKVVILTNHGGKDAGKLAALIPYVDGNECSPGLGINTGNSLRLNEASCGNPLAVAISNHLVVVGHFVDGSQQVLLDTYQ